MTVVYFMLVACFVALTDARASPYAHLKGGNRLRTYGEDCNSDKMTCVLLKDCKFDCPPNFQRVAENGACYYVYKAIANDLRTFTEAQDYCKGISDSQLWIEDSEELDSLLLEPTITTPVYLNAEYSRNKHAWVWANNDRRIEWNLILQSLPNKASLVDAIENAALNTCFLLNPMTNTIDLVACTEQHGYICKMGKANGECTQTGQTKCCYTPSFDFYLRNQQYGHDHGLQLGPEGCKMKIGNDQINCETVLNGIPLTSQNSLTRIGSSYFYFAQSNVDCEIREAVVSNKNIHDYIMLYMATLETSFVAENVKIGLIFNPDDGMAHWSNGKSEDFYKTFWFPGEPIRDEAVNGGCAAYSRVPDTFTYLWKLFTSAECDNMMKICELPVFRSPITRPSTISTCGKRKDRGILAKSFYSIYDTDEATFGEFPWHAAISYYQKIGSGAKRVFACSGALINGRFVLTSAHCVSSIRHSDIVVTLGEHDLKDDETLLEPVVLEVTDTIIHPGFGDYHTYSDDIALLQLKTKVEVDDYPHVGLGCLPTPHQIRSHLGRWECFSVGWPKQEYGYRRVLNRVDVSFTSEEYCRNYNYDYYKSLFYEHSRSKYDDQSRKAHFYSSAEPELLCARPNYRSSCVDDETSILVCKKETTYVQNPFFSSDSAYNSNPYPSKETSQEGSTQDYRGRSARSPDGGTKYSRQHYKGYHQKVDYILNTYGEDRFDSDTWYIIGVGHGSFKCGKTRLSEGSYDYNRESSATSKPSDDQTEIYSSVYEYLPFIHYVIDLYHTPN